MNNAPGRPWSELEDETVFELDLDGFKYRLAEPSIMQLLARGFVPQALVFGGHAAANGTAPEIKFLADEKVQDQMILTHVVEPVLWAGPVEECPAGQVPLARIGRHRDQIINAVLGKVFDSKLVRGVAFRGEGGPEPEASPGGESVGADDRGATASA